jgi:(p)ppGpp synthase/HD superfamily hydrolase
MDNILQKVEAFARQAHGSQVRKFVNEPYINHPIRVMQTCARITDDITILAAALLHDVLEDTAVTGHDILRFLRTVMPAEQAKRTLQLVIELTDVFTHAAYPSLNRRARKIKENERLATTSADSRTIKYADIIDNANDVDDDFGPKLLNEMAVSLQAIPGGNEELYQLAANLVQRRLLSLKKNLV